MSDEVLRQLEIAWQFEGSAAIVRQAFLSFQDAMKPNGRCATCKHWGSEYPREDDLDRRSCAAIHTSTEFDTPKELAVFAADGRGGFWTRAEFGCVLWEGK